MNTRDTLRLWLRLLTCKQLVEKQVRAQLRAQFDTTLSRRMMGACALLPRLIGQGRASELLFTGRVMTAAEGLQWGFFNSLHDNADLPTQAQQLASGTTCAHGMTKTMLHQEWAMTPDQAIEAEAQAICMQTQDFTRTYEAFAAKQQPVFKGN